MNRMPALRFAVPVAALAVVMLMGAAWFTMSNAVAPASNSQELSDPEVTNTPIVAPVVGAYAPNFAADDLDGRKVALSEFRGQIILLNFWATW